MSHEDLHLGDCVMAVFTARKYDSKKERMDEIESFTSTYISFSVQALILLARALQEPHDIPLPPAPLPYPVSEPVSNHFVLYILILIYSSM